MANHKSALKRARQNELKRMRNKTTRTRVKNVVKDLRQTIATSPQDAGSKLHQAQSVIDRAAQKGVLHKKTAARKISRLVKQTNGI